MVDYEGIAEIDRFVAPPSSVTGWLVYPFKLLLGAALVLVVGPLVLALMAFGPMLILGLGLYFAGASDAIAVLAGLAGFAASMYGLNRMGLFG